MPCRFSGIGFVSGAVRGWVGELKIVSRDIINFEFKLGAWYSWSYETENYHVTVTRVLVYGSKNPSVS